MFSFIQSAAKGRCFVSISGFRHWTSLQSQLIHNKRQLHISDILIKVTSNKRELFLRPFKATSNSMNKLDIHSHICRFKSFDFSKKDINSSPVKNANWWTKWKRQTIRYETQALSSRDRNISTLLYLISAAVLTCGASYAAVPLYRMFCSATSYGGTTQVGHDSEKVEAMETKKDRLLQIKFTADTAAQMQWNFRPQQDSINVYAGETALAFYTAKNPTDKPIDGISTYNVIPFEAGQYFNKIQCFCFEEQRLNSQEEVDMPVFFYIDPDYLEDPFLEDIDTVYLSYTFFESKPGMTLPTYNSR